MPFVEKPTTTSISIMEQHSLPSSVSSGPRWSFEEERLLQEAVLRYGASNWDTIAAYLRKQSVSKVKRTSIMCEKRWHQIITSGVKRGHWTTEEDQVITDAVNEQLVMMDINPMTRTSAISCIDIKWADVSKKLSGLRTGKQCRERYSNHLDPTLKKSAWSSEEDMQLIKNQAVLGNSWTRISMEMPGRSENEVKNRWYSVILRRYGDDLAYYQSLYKDEEEARSMSDANFTTSSFNEHDELSNVRGTQRGASKRRSAGTGSHKDAIMIEDHQDTAPTKMKRGEKSNGRTSTHFSSNQQIHDDTASIDERSVSMMTTDSLDPPAADASYTHGKSKHHVQQQHKSIQHTSMSLQQQQQQQQQKQQQQHCYLDTISNTQQYYHGGDSHNMSNSHSSSHHAYDRDSSIVSPPNTQTSKVLSYSQQHQQASELKSHRPLSPFTYDRIFDSINTFMADAYYLMSRLHKVSKEDLTAQDYHILHYTELYGKWRRDHYHYPSHYRDQHSSCTMDSCTTSLESHDSVTRGDASSSIPTTMEDFAGRSSIMPNDANETTMRRPTLPIPSVKASNSMLPQDLSSHPMIVVPLHQGIPIFSSKSISQHSHSMLGGTNLTTSYNSSNDDDEISIATFLYSRFLGSNRTSAVCSTTNSSTASISGDFKHLLEDDSPPIGKSEDKDNTQFSNAKAKEKVCVISHYFENESPSALLLSGDISLSSSPGWESSAMSGLVSNMHLSSSLSLQHQPESSCVMNMDAEGVEV